MVAIPSFRVSPILTHFAVAVAAAVCGFFLSSRWLFWSLIGMVGVGTGVAGFGLCVMINSYSLYEVIRGLNSPMGRFLIFNTIFVIGIGTILSVEDHDDIRIALLHFVRGTNPHR